MKFMTELPKATEEQFNAMTDNEKRVYLLQLKQATCAEWQTVHSAIVVITCAISVGIGLLALFINVVA